MADDALLWLLTDEAAALMTDPAVGAVTPAALSALRERVGGQAPADRAAALTDLCELRRRAHAKFDRAERMFFTRKSYEQATDAVVARYKAQRFQPFDRVIDACCGIGGDLIGLAGVVADSIGVEVNPALAAFAERNLLAYGFKTRVSATRLDAVNFPECDAWHADPDRRPAGHRTTDPEAHEPSLATLREWRGRVGSAAVKLAPAAELPTDWQAECELEWISRGGECRQQVAWTGRLAERPGQRRATRLCDGRSPASIIGLPTASPPVADSLGEWLYEPDPSVLAAGLIGPLAERHGLAAVAPRVAYLTGGTRIEDGLLAAFRVVEAMPFDRKRLAKWLAKQGVGRLEIKVRGVEVRPEPLRRELKPRGDESATLLVFPDGAGKRRVVIANRCDAPHAR